MLTLHLLDTGYCIVSEHHVISGGRRRAMACHATVALLHHPERGWLLWDTGYAPRFLEATRGWPFLLYRLATPVRLRAEEAVVAQLARFGIGPDDIATIVISHFHADHIAGLRDFPRATFFASRTAVERIAGLRGLAALRCAFIPALLPEDFAARLRVLPDFSGPPLGTFGPSHDLFGDGSLQLVALPGHARGQIGALVATTGGPVLLAADGCWLSQSYRENRPPHPITSLIADDQRAVTETITRLHHFARAHPEVQIVPCHCPEAFRGFSKI